MWNGISSFVGGLFGGAAGKEEPEPAEDPARFEDLYITEIDDVSGMLNDEYVFGREVVLGEGFDALCLGDTCRAEIQRGKVLSVLRLRSKTFQYRKILSPKIVLKPVSKIGFGLLRASFHVKMFLFQN